MRVGRAWLGSQGVSGSSAHGRGRANAEDSSAPTAPGQTGRGARQGSRISIRCPACGAARTGAGLHWQTMSQENGGHNPLLPPRAEMLAAVRARDRRYEGVFVFGVRTTGVFCRPGCPARSPRPENTAFYSSGEEAQADGLRACRRCRPERAAGAAPEWMRALEAELACRGTERLTDADLAERGLEAKAVRRAFLARYGLTFHAWQRARALERARERLGTGETVLAAALE